MRNLRSKVWMAVGVLGVVLGAGLRPERVSAAQQAPGNYPGNNPGQTGNRQQQGIPAPTLGEPPSESDEVKARAEQQRVKMQIDERQKHLQADTERLVELSNELKEEVDKSGKYVTSVAAMRKAEEIEKLAHSVRDRMKN